jgi:hypothetical protein
MFEFPNIGTLNIQMDSPKFSDYNSAKVSQLDGNWELYGNFGKSSHLNTISAAEDITGQPWFFWFQWCKNQLNWTRIESSTATLGKAAIWTAFQQVWIWSHWRYHRTALIFVIPMVQKPTQLDRNWECYSNFGKSSHLHSISAGPNLEPLKISPDSPDFCDSNGAEINSTGQ